MSRPPAKPKIYHITHVDNLPSIISDGGLVSDRAMIQREDPAAGIGMSRIKQRRLFLPVKCHPGELVGDYVPFYFCPRSIMLYVIWRANHPDLSYRGGQDPIVHLEADLHDTVAWADSLGHRWAFSLSNAGAVYTEFRAGLSDLHEVDWDAVAATDFRSETVAERKQAEFLVHGSFPWDLVVRIGVQSMRIKLRVDEAVQLARHSPKVEVLPDWYY